MNPRVWLFAAAAPLVLAVSALAGTTSGDTIVFGLSVHGKPDRAVVMRSDGTGKRVLKLPAGACAGCLQVSRDGTRLLTAASAGRRVTTAVEALDGTGYKALPLPGRTLNLGPGAWSPDGRGIAFEGWGSSDRTQNGLYTAHADGTGLRRLTESPGGGHDIPLVYSPNGTWILFARSKTADDSDPADLYAVRSDGGALRKLNPAWTSVRWNFGSPASWSADGRTIAFAAFEPAAADTGRSAVFTVTPLGRGLKRITSWGVWTTSARFSPDGALIAFDRLHAGLTGHDLVVVRPDGSGTRTVVSDAHDGIGSCCASWSPDSSALVFERGDASAATLWTVHADGTGLKEVSRTAAEYPFYAWVR